MRPAASGLQSSPAQQSVAFLQSSPTARQWLIIIIGPGMSVQRRTPGGPSVQLPEQHSALEAHRSCEGRQPGAHAQRVAPSGVGSHRPEQQSMSVLQISSAGWQSGSAWQFPLPPGPALHWPVQQSVGAVQGLVDACKKIAPDLLGR